MGEKCGTLCAYLVPQTGMAYLSFSVYTTTTLVNEIPTVFPKITISNSVLASTEYAYEIVKVINEQLFPTISIFNQSQMSNLSFDQMQLLFAAFQYYNIKINLNSFTTQESILASILGKTWQVAGSCKFLQDGRLSRI
jgi:hypothetical protein